MIDNVDARIINILQKNGRISMNKLAESIPMSVPATCERVHKLEDKGIINGYTVQLSPMAVGKTINAFILFACNIGEIDKVREILNHDHRIISAHFLAGKYTMMLEVSCADMNEYLDLIQILFPLGMSESYIQIECIKERFYDLLSEE